MPTLAFPKRDTHADVRSRASLTAAEVDHRRNTARRVGRHGLRHATMLLAARHGLRVSALMALRWDQLDSANDASMGVAWSVGNRVPICSRQERGARSDA